MSAPSLRRLVEADVPMILPWRSHPDVRRFMYTQHEIGTQEHAAFFAQALHDPTCEYYLGLEDGAPIGVVAFRDIDVGQETASWGFYTRPGSPVGAGRRMLMLALDQAFVADGLAKLSGEALAFNQASIRLHVKLGFSVEGILNGQREHHGRRIDVVRMGMLASDWTPEHKAWLHRAVESRPRSDDRDQAIVLRTTNLGGLVPLVATCLAACVGRVSSLHVDATRLATHGGAVELTLRRVSRAAGQAAYAIEVIGEDGAGLASGSAHVVIAKGVS